MKKIIVYVCDPNKNVGCSKTNCKEYCNHCHELEYSLNFNFKPDNRILDNPAWFQRSDYKEKGEPVVCYFEILKSSIKIK